VTDLRFAQVEVAGDIRHQTHDGELAGADGKTAHGQGQFDQQHGSGGQGRSRCGGWRGHGYLVTSKGAALFTLAGSGKARLPKKEITGWWDCIGAPEFDPGKGGVRVRGAESDNWMDGRLAPVF